MCIYAAQHVEDSHHPSVRDPHFKWCWMNFPIYFVNVRQCVYMYIICILCIYIYMIIYIYIHTNYVHVDSCLSYIYIYMYIYMYTHMYSMIGMFTWLCVFIRLVFQEMKLEVPDERCHSAITSIKKCVKACSKGIAGKFSDHNVRISWGWFSRR